MDIAERLSRIQGEVYREHGVECRPWGDEAAIMILDMARKIITEGLAPKIRLEDLEMLTEVNAHMARQAAEVALGLLSR